MPTQDRIGRDNGGQLHQGLSAQEFAFDGEESALVIGQSKALAVELPFEDAVLFDKIVDDVLLVSVEPAGQGDYQQMKWLSFLQ